MRFVFSLIYNFVVLLVVMILFEIELPIVNDSVLVGLSVTTLVYWVVTFAAASIIALFGGLLGGFAGAVISDDNKVAIGCGYLVAVPLATIADIYILMNLHNLDSLYFFPVFTLGQAIIISLVTTAIGLLYNRK